MDYIANSNDLTSVANAIRTRGGTSAPLSFPSGFVSAIGAIPSGGGGGAETKSLNFYDYDGTLVESFTTAEALALSSLPANPTHTGLTAQGWNWSLASIKSYLTDYPDATVNVGQMYITDDGKTRIYITLDDPDALSPYLAIAVNGTVSVDWGDGSTPDTMTGSSTSNVVYCQHVYDSVGEYVISIEVVSGSFAFYTKSSSDSSCLIVSNNNRIRSRLYSKAITKINIGSNVHITSNAFHNCYSLLSVNIPDDITDIGINAFSGCYSLSSITIPDSVTSIGTSAINACYLLSSIAIPNGVTSINDSAFQNCYSLSSITIPDSVTSIGNSAFSGCSLLQSITIPDSVTSIRNSLFSSCNSLQSITIPDSVTNIGANAFYNCYSLLSVNIPDDITSIGSSAFQGCPALSSITIPDGVTSIGNTAFQSCYSLSSVNIPDGVTSIGSNTFYSCYSLSSITIPDSVTSIRSSAFQNCYSLSSITIPDGVTSIESNAFNNCYGIFDYHFKSTTPPTLANVNAFTNILPDTIIYVPYSEDHSVIEAYKTATNWSTYASRMQEEPQ